MLKHYELYNFKKNKTPDTQARQKSTPQMTQTDDRKGYNPRRRRAPAYNTGLEKLAAQCFASTFVVKIATFAKPQTVMPNGRTTTNN